MIEDLWVEGMLVASDDLLESSYLHGKVALVTGGSRGLGRAIVEALASHGADVVIASRKIDNCREVAEQIISGTGRRALPVACHVGKWNEIDDLVNTAYSHFGHIDILVNNAGISPLYPSLSQVSEKLWDSTLSVNLKGPFRLSSLIGERMSAGDGGSIINISSIGAVRAGPDIAPYAASKAGLNALTQAFAHAFGPQVRVNAIMLGSFDTGMIDPQRRAALASRAERLALRRIGQPAEVVGSVLYLAGPAATYTTGAVLPVDGGTPL